MWLDSPTSFTTRRNRASFPRPPKRSLPTLALLTWVSLLRLIVVGKPSRYSPRRGKQIQIESKMKEHDANFWGGLKATPAAAVASDTTLLHDTTTMTTTTTQLPPPGLGCQLLIGWLLDVIVPRCCLLSSRNNDMWNLLASVYVQSIGVQTNTSTCKLRFQAIVVPVLYHAARLVPSKYSATHHMFMFTDHTLREGKCFQVLSP